MIKRTGWIFFCTAIVLFAATPSSVIAQPMHDSDLGDLPTPPTIQIPSGADINKENGAVNNSPPVVKALNQPNSGIPNIEPGVHADDDIGDLNHLDDAPAKPIIAPVIATAEVIPTIQIAATPIPEQSWPDQVSALKYDLQKTSYDINPSLPNRMALVAAAEGILNIHCEEASPYRGFERADRPKCNALIQSTLLLDPQNPAALCARDGMSASSCYQSYEHVNAFPLRSDSPAMQNKDVENFINANAPEDISAITQTLENQAFEYKKAPNASKKEALVIAFHNAASKYCIPLAYEIDFTPDATGTIPPTAIPSGTVKPFAGIVADLAKKPSDAKAVEIVATHRRLFSSACFDIGELIAKTFPDSYILTCTNKGFYSPQCQKVYRTQTVKPRTNSSSNGSGRDGLGKF